MTRLSLLLACIAAVLGAATGAYLLGWWIPNNPLGKYPVKGIDVSHHQGDIDWNAVAHDGVKFVYIKASEGSDFRDDHFRQNRDGAIRAGLPWGAYHYFTLRTPGAIQAENFIETVGMRTPLPPAVDIETWGNSNARPSKEIFQRELTAYMDAIRRAFRTEPVIYTSSDFVHSYLQGYPIKRLWYRAVVSTPHLDGFDQWNFWQFTERAHVKGIDGFVDMDVFHDTPEALVTWPDLPKEKAL